MKRKALFLLFVVVFMSLPQGGLKATSMCVEDISLAQQTNVVYVTPHGEKYHKSTCHYLKKSTPRAMSKSEAIRLGYGACKVCKP